MIRKAEENALDELDTTGDLFALGLHLFFDHNLDDPNAFDTFLEFRILDITSPLCIERKEYSWMHKINTFQPVGINIEYPFGIPLLGQR